MYGAADYFGASVKVPERPVPTLADLERQVGKTEDIIGTIPKPAELKSQIQAIDKEIEQDTLQSEKIANISSSPSVSPMAKKKRVPK